MPSVIGLLFDLLLVDPMTNVLVALARVFGGNFGIAIIVFTLVMKGITWPLTASQYKQSRAMQALQPKLQELQKKHKGKDPKKLQAETMALYKEAGFNPLGCLFPMLAQFPIWIALYRVINRSLGETPESFVTLSQQLYPTPFVHTAVPLNNHLLYWNLGQPDVSYVLPVLVAFTMYVQQKMIQPAQASASNANSQAAQTQQMMTWMLPLMFGFWSLSVPAGLALYWFISNVSGLIIQYFYMGRRVEWANLLKFNPVPAPAPAARGGRAAQQTNGKKAEDRPREATEQVAPSADIDGATARPAAAAGGQGGRGRRHGRRRGKR